MHCVEPVVLELQISLDNNERCCHKKTVSVGLSDQQSQLVDRGYVGTVSVLYFQGLVWTKSIAHPNGRYPRQSRNFTQDLTHVNETQTVLRPDQAPVGEGECKSFGIFISSWKLLPRTSTVTLRRYATGSSFESLYLCM
jgi:hypothetical protein